MALIGLEYFTVCWMALAEGVGKVLGLDRREREGGNFAAFITE